MADGGCRVISGEAHDRRLRSLLADAGTGAVLGLSLVAVRAGTLWLGCGLLGIALIWIVVRSVLEARRLKVKWQPFGQQTLLRVLAAGVTLVAVVGPGRGLPPWAWPVWRARC